MNRILIGASSMTTDDQSLNAFLEHDFAHQDENHSRLALLGPKHDPCLTTIFFGHSFQLWKKLQKGNNTSLKKIAEFIQARQRIWHRTYPDLQTRIEKQSAWIYQKVWKHNLSPVHSFIPNKTFRWRITIQFRLNFSMEDGMIDCDFTTIKKTYKFYSLTTHAQVAEKYEKLKQTKLNATVLCMNKVQCSKETHQIKVIVAELFRWFTLRKTSFQLNNSSEYLLGVNEKGHDLNVAVEASQVNHHLLSKLIKSHHQELESKKLNRKRGPKFGFVSLD